MRKKIILRLFLLTAFMALLWSCRNEDFAKGEKEAQRNNADFFKHSKKNGANARSGADYITILEDYNRETDFLSQMPDQKGMPIWEKIYAIETENGAGIMIPLSHDNESMSSILFATFDGKNAVTGVKDYDNTILQNTVYNQKISVENREQFFFTFMFMDNRTFGNEHFTAIPNDLFVGNKYDAKHGMMGIRDFTPSSEVITQQAGRLFISQTCVTVLHCTHHNPGICDGCNECQTTTCTPIILGTADDPFPTTPGGGGGGHGGGGGCNDCEPGGWPPSGPNVPENPCGGNTVSSVFYRPAPGCGGGTLPEVDDPCEKTKKLLEKQETKNVVDDLKNHINSGVGGEKGWAFNKNGNVTPTTGNGPHSVIFGNPSLLNGIYHNHTGTKVDIFSATDVSTLLEIARYQSMGNAGNAFSGMVAPNGIHYVMYFNGNHSDLPPSDSFSEIDLTALKIYQLRVMWNLLDKDTSGIYCNIGNNTLNSKGLEKIFFDTLNKMGLADKIMLQKIDPNGNVSSVTKNNDGTITDIPCP